jgi:hypothetical protein
MQHGTSVIRRFIGRLEYLVPNRLTLSPVTTQGFPQYTLSDMRQPVLQPPYTPVLT